MKVYLDRDVAKLTQRLREDEKIIDFRFSSYG